MASEAELREAINYRRHVKRESLDYLLVSEELYRVLVEKLGEYRRPWDEFLPPSHDLMYLGIRVKVYRSSEERIEKKMWLWEQGQRVLEVV